MEEQVAGCDAGRKPSASRRAVQEVPEGPLRPEEQVPDSRSRAALAVPAQQSRFRGICARLGLRRRDPASGQKGQALVEYVLVLLIALTFTHQVFFNQNWGFRGILQKTMLRLGSFLEQNLKSGTKVGGADGKLSLDPYAGTDRWTN